MKTKPDPKTEALIQCVYAIKMVIDAWSDAHSVTRLDHNDYVRLDKAYRVGQAALGRESTVPQ